MKIESMGYWSSTEKMFEQFSSFILFYYVNLNCNAPNLDGFRNLNLNIGFV